MRLVLISDTHGLHRSISLPEGDVLIHAGDCTNRGKKEEVLDFLDWFSSQAFEYLVFIAGNHDLFFEREPDSIIQEVIPDQVIYLNDSGITIGDYLVWGSPVQPWFLDWAFNRERGTEIDQHWALIPPEVDILITHGPPYGILDRTVRQAHVGCEALAARLPDLQPRLHVFGHIHESYGSVERGGSLFVNASSLDVRHHPIHPPKVVDII